MKKIAFILGTFFAVNLFAQITAKQEQLLRAAFDYEAHPKVKDKLTAIHTDLLIVKYKDKEAAKAGFRLPDRIAERLGVLRPFDQKYAAVPIVARGFLERLHTKGEALSKLEQRLLNYYHYRLARKLNLEESLSKLDQVMRDPTVEYAYFQPAIHDAQVERPTPSPQAAPTRHPADPDVIPNFQDKQFYLEMAPTGISAKAAWTVPGGTGAWVENGVQKRVRISDVETGWYTDHVDLNTKTSPSDLSGNPVYTNGINAPADHGTAVWGELAAKNDGLGVTGIIFGAEYALSGVQWEGNWDNYHPSLDQTLTAAIANLQKGDLLVIEQQAVGPQGDFIPVEYWQATYDIIKNATDHGIFCVAAGGNGSQNLDDLAYGSAFDFKNVNFANPAQGAQPARDSGCIIVGAGGAPNGATPLQRLDFSSYGSRIDAFGSGENVVSTGYGDLYGQGDNNRGYTAEFNGTSSATPIVAGAMGSVIGVARANSALTNKLTNQSLRFALRSTGTPQKADAANPDTATDRVGNLPDLCQLDKILFNITPAGCPI